MSEISGNLNIIYYNSADGDIATKKITNSITLSGVIDYKENEILPFIYVSIGVDDGRLVVFLGSGSRLEYFDFYGKRITQGG